jgi:hypothetical protein
MPFARLEKESLRHQGAEGRHIDDVGVFDPVEAALAAMTGF